MATDPKASLSPNRSPEPLPAEVEQALASGLGPYTLPERLGWLLSSLGVAERQAYLERIGRDKPNGFYDRGLQVGTVPLELRVPRTRLGDFRPASWPGGLPARLPGGHRSPFALPAGFGPFPQRGRERLAENEPLLLARRVGACRSRGEGRTGSAQQPSPRLRFS